MKILVTGAAGFIGSHLCERLLKDPSNKVVGVDTLLDASTPRWIRLHNVEDLQRSPRFILIEADLYTMDWQSVLEDVEVVYHLAGVPGVRSSWGKDFSAYVQHNILATQTLLEECRKYDIKKFIYTSTSSVYGEKSGKVSESALTAPLSPYGVTKLSGEHLCRVFYQNDGMPITVLRLFTVYGPRQRPDMAFHKFIKNVLEQQPIEIYGNGLQTRDFTYVSDCVEGIAAAAYADNIAGETINIGGRERASILTCVNLLEESLQQKIDITFVGSIYGEPRHTWADIAKAQTLLNYEPSVTLQEGLLREVEDLQRLYSVRLY